LLALTGIAFVLIYKATKVLNLAVGEMLMLCAYFFFG
jgi:branched-chain amino acid transport system permease protein